MTEERENWVERKGKKTTPEGTQFLTLSHPFVSDNNELCERKDIIFPIQLYSTNIETRYTGEVNVKIVEDSNDVQLYWKNRFTDNSKFQKYEP